MKYRQLVFATIIAALLALGSTVTAEEETEFEPTKSYIGLTFGTPGGLNFGGSHYIINENTGVQWSAGYVGREYTRVGGLQAGVVFRMSESRHLLTEWGLVGGYLGMKAFGHAPITWTYIAATISIRYRALFAETGLSFGTGDYPNPQALLQLGFVLKSFR